MSQHRRVLGGLSLACLPVPGKPSQVCLFEACPAGPAAGARTRETVEQAWPVLTTLGLTSPDDADPTSRLTVVDDAREGVDGA